MNGTLRALKQSQKKLNTHKNSLQRFLLQAKFISYRVLLLTVQALMQGRCVQVGHQRICWR